MAEIKAEIVHARDITRLDRAGIVVPMVQITYTIGNLGPFRLEIPKREATPERIKELLEKEVERWKPLLET